MKETNVMERVEDILTGVLRPCPFCNGKAERMCTNLYDSMAGIPPKYTIRCSDCGTMLGGEHSIREAIEAWNRRAE